MWVLHSKQWRQINVSLQWRSWSTQMPGTYCMILASIFNCWQFCGNRWQIAEIRGKTVLVHMWHLFVIKYMIWEMIMMRHWCLWDIKHTKYLDLQPIRDRARKSSGDSHRSATKHQHAWLLQATISSSYFSFFPLFFPFITAKHHTDNLYSKLQFLTERNPVLHDNSYLTHDYHFSHVWLRIVVYRQDRVVRNSSYWKDV